MQLLTLLVLASPAPCLNGGGGSSLIVRCPFPVLSLTPVLGMQSGAAAPRHQADRRGRFQQNASICPVCPRPSLVPSPYRCLIVFLFSVPVIFQTLFFPSSFFFFYSLATLVCIIIICPERALSERGLFVLQPGTRLFSGSAVFFPSPSVPSQYPGEICFCL